MQKLQQKMTRWHWLTLLGTGGRGLLLIIALGILYGLEPDVPDSEVAAAAALAGYQRAIFGAHVFFVLLWHPSSGWFARLDDWRSGGWRRLAVLAAGGAVLAITLNFWVLLFWCALLAGLVAGRVLVYPTRALRLFHGIALSFLILLIVLEVMPGLLPLPVAIPSAATRMYRIAGYTLPALLGVMLLCLVWHALQSASARRKAPTLALIREHSVTEAHDVLYAAVVFVLVLFISLTALLLMLLGGVSYFSAWTASLLMLASLLLIITWGFGEHDALPMPGQVGKSGLLSLIFGRYVMSLGVPFEAWLEALTERYRAAATSQEFLNEALGLLRGVPKLTAATWQINGSTVGGFANDQLNPKNGKTAKLVRETISVQLSQPVDTRVLEVALDSHAPLGAAMLWHLKLLIQLAAELYAAKWREERLAQANYVRAVHETGARVTHDIKNLLQSLQGMVAVAQSGVEPNVVQQLFERQMPTIAQRLQAALDKLKAPSTDSQRLVLLSVWLREAMARTVHLADMQLEWIPAQIGFDAPIPPRVFDTVLDNLLANAAQKGHAARNAPLLGDRSVPLRPVTVRVALRTQQSYVSLSVTDDGHAVPPQVVQTLFDSPVTSSTGLGIGLYQAAQFAAAHQFSLTLAHNAPGEVIFALSNAPPHTT